MLLACISVASLPMQDTEHGEFGNQAMLNSISGPCATDEEYDSYHESRTGNVCAGGKYDSYHESRTGETACGGQYDSYHESRTGNVCAGGSMIVITRAGPEKQPAAAV